MNFGEEQIEAAAYIFEARYMNNKSLLGYELNVVSESGIKDIEPEVIEKHLVELLEDPNTNINIRGSIYWALGKCYTRFTLIPLFKRWLKVELERNEPVAVYQILISLQNLEEEVFHKNRTGTAYNEYDLNIRDAKEYLKKTTENHRKI